MADDATKARLRFDALRADRPQLRLFTLVDGLVFERTHGQALVADAHCIALLDQTPDAALASHGPWLLDAEHHTTLADQLRERERDAPHVSWLLAEMPLAGLAQLLRLKLDARLPDGRVALLRFYDPRVLHRLATTLTPAQRHDFFAHVLEWHFHHDGRALRIGRHPDA